jgi:hypothetical protein
LATDWREELHRLRREVAELCKEKEVLGKAAAYFAAETTRWAAGRSRFVDDHRGAYGVKRICRVLEIDRSSYYDQLAGAAAREARDLADNEHAKEIAAIHAESGGAYGAMPGALRRC